MNYLLMPYFQIMSPPNSVVLVHPTCGPTQQDDIPGKVRYLTYKELEEEISDERDKMGFFTLFNAYGRAKRSSSTYDNQKKLWMHSLS